MDDRQYGESAEEARLTRAAPAAIPALDGIRGLAILLVLWAHFGPPQTSAPVGGLRLCLHNLLGAGWAGVDLFFVLSGFLITGILLEAKRARADAGLAGWSGAAGFFGRFYARRALRIFPLYYFVLAMAGICAAAWGDPSDHRAWREWSPWLWCYAGNIFNVRCGWQAGPHGLLFDHFWSLAVEEQFYLLWPFVVYACDRRVLLRGSFALAITAVALRYWCEVVNGDNFSAMLLMPCRLDALAIGAILALLGPAAPVHRRDACATRGGRHRSTAVSAVSAHDGITPCSIGIARCRPHSPPGGHRRDACATARLARTGAWMTGASLLLVPVFGNWLWLDLIGRTLLAIVFGGLILLALTTPLRRVFEAAWLRILGKYSYGIYILHFLFYRKLDGLFPAARLGTGGRFLACSLASLALAWCSWQLIEKRFVSLKRLCPMSGPPDREWTYDPRHAVRPGRTEGAN